MRDSDIVCRYGGEEFVVVLPDSAATEAEGLFERFSEELASVVVSGEVPPFPVSVGLADSLVTMDTTEVVGLADAAMFEAKQAGRNQIALATPATHGPTQADGLLESPKSSVGSIGGLL